MVFVSHREARTPAKCRRLGDCPTGEFPPLIIATTNPTQSSLRLHKVTQWPKVGFFLLERAAAPIMSPFRQIITHSGKIPRRKAHRKTMAPGDVDYDEDGEWKRRRDNSGGGEEAEREDPRMIQFGFHHLKQTILQSLLVASCLRSRILDLVDAAGSGHINGQGKIRSRSGFHGQRDNGEGRWKRRRKVEIIKYFGRITRSACWFIFYRILLIFQCSNFVFSWWSCGPVSVPLEQKTTTPARWPV